MGWITEAWYTVAVMAKAEIREQFVREYVIDFNGTQAAIRCGYSPTSANHRAQQLLAEADVQDAIAEIIAQRAKASAISVEWVLQEWRDIASADPSELITLRIDCCRHCYGENHEYQWTQFEYNQTTRRCLEHFCNAKCEQPCMKRVPPMPLGGFGYSPHNSPNPDCPVCHGDGTERVRVADLRDVTGSARRLYAGLKKTKDGLEIKFRDQDKALENIAKFLRMLVNPTEISGPGGGAIPMAANVSAEDLTDDQIAQMLLKLKSVDTLVNT